MLKKAPPIAWPMLIMKGLPSVSQMRIDIRNKITQKVHQTRPTLIILLVFRVYLQILGTIAQKYDSTFGLLSSRNHNESQNATDREM